MIPLFLREIFLLLAVNLHALKKWNYRPFYILRFLFQSFLFSPQGHVLSFFLVHIVINPFLSLLQFIFFLLPRLLNTCSFPLQIIYNFRLLYLFFHVVPEFATLSKVFLNRVSEFFSPANSKFDETTV